MPVTAKLSKLFYDRLGEQIANELVDWFNQVDATYAKLEQRLAELNAKWGVRWDKLDAKLERRLAEFEARLERRLGEQTRWLFVAWASLLIPIIGLWIRG
jgi:enoyl reductase-like protein